MHIHRPLVLGIFVCICSVVSVLNAGDSVVLVHQMSLLLCVCSPFFTYWVTVVQIVCFILSIVVFGIARIGGAMTTISDEVSSLVANLNLLNEPRSNHFIIASGQFPVCTLYGHDVPLIRMLISLPYRSFASFLPCSAS